ncbi:hypothetical protein GE061_017319 [Apolygus lucorum]|uniref:CLIP1 zinc knuckle domain-containing protein n=1 Tax=Apolygus lucorum TaxID=248454 RepID=A0A8S9XC43_APOLU|nr:hypothetical protein GE061_017319 [Apolygus lucorum]
MKKRNDPYCDLSNSHLVQYLQHLLLNCPRTQTSLNPILHDGIAGVDDRTEDLVKCKQDQINQLLKEKQMDRAALTNAAQQADDLERKLGVLQTDYDKVCATMTELKVRNDVAALEATEMKTKNDRLKAKVDELQAQLEDVQFRAEEETIIKSDIQGTNQKNEEKIRELEQLLLIEQTKNESLLDDAAQVKEALKKVEALQTELKYAISSKEEMEKTLKKELIDTIDRANRMEQSYNKAQDDLDKIVSDSETNKSQRLENSSHETEKLKNELESIKTQNKEIQNLVVKLENGRSELMKTIESKNEEVARLNDELTNLQKKSAEEETEKQIASLKQESLMRDFDNLKIQYDTKCKEYSEASASLETLNANLQETQRSLASQSEITDNLKKEIENNKSSSSSQLEAVSRSLESELTKVKDELSRSAEMLKNKEVELEKARTVCGELTVKISAVQADCNKMIADIQEKDGKCEELQSSIAEKETSIKQLEGNLSSAQGSSSKIIQDLNAKIKDLTHNLEKERLALSETVNTQVLLIVEKDRAVEELNAKLLSLETEFKSLGSSKATLEEELNQTKKQLSSETENLEQLKVQLRTKETDISAKTEEIAELKKSAEELREGKSAQRRLADATDRCDQLSTQKTKLENDMAQMIDSSSDSSSQLTRINVELNKTLKELDELKLSSSEAAREHKNREQEISQQLESVKLSNEELRKELNTQKELNEAQNNLIQNKLKVTISELESKLEESVSSHVTTKQQKDALNERVVQLEQSLKEMSFKFEESVKIKEDAEKNLEETKKLIEAGEIDKSDKSKEIDSLVCKISTLEKDFKIISGEKLQLIEKLKDLEAACSESSVGLAKLKEDNSSLVAKLNALSCSTGSEMSELKKFVDEKDDVIKNQLSTIEGLKSQLGAADELIEKTNKEIEGKNEELLVFKTSLKDNEEVRQNIVKEKEALSAENEKLENQAAELTDRIKTSKEKESQLMKEIDVMGQRLQNLESSLEASSKSVEALKENLRDKERQLSDIQQSSTAKEAELSARIAAMNKQLSELNIVLEMSQEEHGDEIDKLKQQHNVLTNDLKKKEEDLIEASEKLAKYENELKMVRANSSKASEALSEEVESLKKILETTISSLNDKLKERESEIKAKCDNEVKLEEQVKSIEGELEKLKKQNDSLLVNAKLNYESEVAELSHQRRKATEELAKLEEQLEESQAQAFRYKQQLETEASNRATTTTDLTKLESQLNLVKQEKLSIEEKLKSTTEDLTRLKSKSDTPRKGAPLDENGATKSEEDAALNNWLEEKELAESQINFLNSIIVDMKKKNDDLQAQLDTSGTNGQKELPPSKVVKEVAPRLFCDICDVFDLHDTEDCPLQASDSPPPTPKAHRIAGSRQLEERPYCEICEVFGHDSSECDDGETF